jgi:hypothetical protein
MGSFGQTFAHTSPVLALPPHLPPQPSFNRPTFTSPFPRQANSSPPTSSWLTPTSAPLSTAGRKRSRDEASLCDEEYFPVQAPEPVVENEDEWVYGEGMTLIKPNKGGYILSADSQTGTWLEEKEAEEKAKAEALRAVSPERPILRSHKSQRLDLGSTSSIADEIKFANSSLPTVNPSLPNGGAGPTEPNIDDYTRHLGIGWSMISADEDIQAAVRGWTKYIENHYPVTNAIIRLQSRGLASYLVEAQEGYFLFGEDLKQGRLVSTNLEKTFENLRGPVPVFEGDMVLEAGETPKATSPAPVMDAMINGHVQDMMMNGTGAIMTNGITPNHAVEIEMDMS